MNLSYILQTKELCVIMFFGFILGIIYEIINIPQIMKAKKILKIVCDAIFSLIFTISFILLINIINSGKIRLFLLAGYILGFIIEKTFLRKTFAKIIKSMYTLIVKWLNILYKSKFGRFILK